MRALARYREEHNFRNPSVPELAGKVIPWATVAGNILVFGSDIAPSFFLRHTHRDKCSNEEDVRGSTDTDRKDIVRLDQYQGDWSFEFGVPPNPLIVDWSANAEETVMDSTGDAWTCYLESTGDSAASLGSIFCSNSEFSASCDVWRGQIVKQHGTYRFPYSTVQRAVTRAEGITAAGGPDPRRSGHGWTLLIKPGNYREAFNIQIPLVLRNYDPSAGTVVIGR